MRQHMIEEAARSQEAVFMASMAKIDDMQNSLNSKVVCGFEQTQCLVGGLQMQLVNTQAQVQALLIGQSQLQAQMLAQQAADTNAAASRSHTKETVAIPASAEAQPQPDNKTQPQ